MSVSALVRSLSKRGLVQLCTTFQLSFQDLTVQQLRKLLLKFLRLNPDKVSLVMATKELDQGGSDEELDSPAPFKLSESTAAGQSSGEVPAEPIQESSGVGSLLPQLLQLAGAAKPESSVREVVSECLRRKVTFEGSEGEDAGNYLCQLDRICNSFSILENSKLQVVGRTLSGRAELWFSQHRFNNYISFVKEFKFAYLSPVYDLKIKKQILNRVQMKGEALHNMVAELNDLNSRLNSPLTEAEILEVVRAGLRPEVWRQVLQQDLRACSMQDLLKVDADCRAADEYEIVYNSLGSTPSKPSYEKCKPAKALKVEVVENKPSKPFNKKPTFNSSIQKVCWNCDKPNHVWSQCRLPRKNKFCYKCGKKGVTLKECDKHGNTSVQTNCSKN